MKNKENARYVKLGLTGAAVVAFGIVLFFLLFRSSGIFAGLSVLGGILRPFIIGAVLAYLVTPLSNRLSRLFGGKRDALADVLTLMIALVVVLAILLLIIPQLINSVVNLAQKLPGEIEVLRQKISTLFTENPDLYARWEPFVGKIDSEVKDAIASLTGKNSGKLASTAMQILGGTANGVFSIFGVLADIMIGVIVSLYFLSKRNQLAAQAKLIVRGLLRPEWADWIENEAKFADRIFNGFFIGKLLDSAIVGVICFVGCLAMRFSSPLLIAVIVGVTNIIPFFGPYIGGGVSALLLVLENPTHCLMFLVFVVLLQQLDGNVIGPKILGESTGLSGLWVMFGIFLFGGLWGIAGMLVGVPLMAVIYDIIRQLTYKGIRGHGREDIIAAYEARFHPADKTPARRKKTGGA